jgi:putative transcriptional regulator
MRALLLAVLAFSLLPAAAADLGRPAILVAKPELRDPVYGASVLVVAPLGGGQHIGFIVNRPTDLTLAALFPEHAPSRKVVEPIYLGGPVEPGAIFALVRSASSPGGSSFELMPGLFAAYEAAVVDRVIESHAQQARFVAGLVAWRAGELEAEIDLGAWLVLDADPALALGTPEGLWEELVRRSLRRRNELVVHETRSEPARQPGKSSVNP